MLAGKGVVLSGNSCSIGSLCSRPGKQSTGVTIVDWFTSSGSWTVHECALMVVSRRVHSSYSSAGSPKLIVDVPLPIIHPSHLRVRPANNYPRLATCSPGDLSLP